MFVKLLYNWYSTDLLGSLKVPCYYKFSGNEDLIVNQPEELKVSVDNYCYKNNSSSTAAESSDNLQHTSGIPTINVSGTSKSCKSDNVWLKRKDISIKYSDRVTGFVSNNQQYPTINL